jgi:chloride channel protein, CIC family
VDPFEIMRVSEVMDRNPPTVRSSTTIAALSEMIALGDSPLSRRQATLLVDDGGRLVGVITRGDIMRSLMDGTATTKKVREAAMLDIEVAYPDETLQVAVAKMLKRDIGRLPVVERSDTAKVVGYLGRAEILEARVRLHEEEELRETGPILAMKAPNEQMREG